MKIWANTIVNNEENFIWFALMSIIDYVDKILVWDSGSTDKTVEIIKEVAKIKGDKIDFKQVGSVDKNEFTKMRKKMLERSHSDWILLLDGDEIWWDESIQKVVNMINRKDKVEGIVVPMIVPVGDIYHLQEEKAGRYQLLGRKGHLNLRAFSKSIPGLHVDFPYGRESFFDEDNRPIQDRPGMVFLNTPYLHVTHLKRSSVKRKYNKYKFELGSKIPTTFQYPEILHKPRPKIVPSPWLKISGLNLFKAQILTPFRKMKRRMV